MPNPESYYFELPVNGAPDFAPLEEEIHSDFQWLTRNRARARGRDVYEVIDTVVIHATAGFATQHAVDTWRKRRASAHWIIPDENEPQHGEFAWATVAEAKAAYHVRDSVDLPPELSDGPNVNNRSLGIEIVNTQNVENYSDQYSEWQIQMTAWIVLYAWAKYPNLRHIISHAKLDPNRRADPGSNFPWPEFQRRVLAHEGLPERNPIVSAEFTPLPPSKDSAGCCLP